MRSYANALLLLDLRYFRLPPEGVKASDPWHMTINCTACLNWREHCERVPCFQKCSAFCNFFFSAPSRILQHGAPLVEDPRYPKQGACLEYDTRPGSGLVKLDCESRLAQDGWVKLGYRDPVADFASRTLSWWGCFCLISSSVRWTLQLQ